MIRKQAALFAAGVCLLLSACRPDIEPDPIETDEQLMTDFMLSKADNPSLKENIVFLFDTATQTFYYHTQEWIDSIHSLVPTFFADGEVYDGNSEVLSATTPMDFSSRPIACQVRKGNTYHNYTIELRCPQSTGIPVFDIRTDNGQDITSKTEYSRASVAVYTTGQAEPYLEQRGQIRGRGNNTWWQPKKPYRLKLDKKAPLFGMQSAKSWVLLANALDPTLLCNTVALEIARRMDAPHTNHTQPVEVFLNRRYCGSYTLTEVVQVKKKRIDVDTIAGGFLGEIDANYDETYKAHSQYFSLPVMVKAPESQAGLDNALSAVNALEKALNRNTISYAEYSEIVDVESVIRYMLLNELVKNGEVCHPKSVFIHRHNGDDLLHFGPVWDFDWAFGYTGRNYRYFFQPENLLFHATGNREPGSKFFGAFLRDPTFCSLYAMRWEEYAARLKDIDLYIYNQGELLRYSQQENAIRWGQEKIHYETQYVLMADFLRRRIAAMNEAYKDYK